MTVEVLCVAYGASQLLAHALAAVHGQAAVLVVDNSSDPAVEQVARASGCRYHDPGSNLGFARGVNLGVALLASGADVLLLNPDAVVPRDAVRVLSHMLRADPRLAAVSPALTDPDGSPQRAKWPFPSPDRMWREAVGRGSTNDRQDDWLVGACLLIRAEALADVGGFDERFFLYAEETDWQRRAVERGWRVALVPDVVVTHVGAGTSSDASRREALFHAGTETYIRKWFGSRGWASYRAAALYGALIRCLVPGETGIRARRRVAIYARGPRRVAGLA